MQKFQREFDAAHARRRHMGDEQFRRHKIAFMTENTGPRPISPGASLQSLRVDKWLWAARFFKTRALASRACDLGRVQCNGLRAKPARDVHAGDRLRIENAGGTFEIDVLGLSAVRGPAAAAQILYRETEASRLARLHLAEERKAMEQYFTLPPRRPSKRDRRRIIQFRGRV